MNILLSAFAFSPKWGSETGVGWHWANELAKTHQVTVVTHDHFRTHVDELPENTLSPNLRMVYVSLAPLHGEFHEQLLNSPFYYFRWQFKAFAVARRMVRENSFDLAHHLTWGTFRLPGFFSFLGIPSVMGPLGGGERAPFHLYYGLPARERAKELVRDALILVGRVDLFSLAALSRADVIYCKTRQTQKALAPWLQRKAYLAQEIGAPAILEQEAPAASTPPSGAQPRSGRLSLLYAGRLLPFKGVHLALRAAANARVRGADVELTVIGSGPMEQPLKLLADRLGLKGRVTFIPQIPQQELFARYAEADVFLFPSLHDSSGNVVLEAFSRGLPVICLDLGGPAEFVDEGCGRAVSVERACLDEVVARLGLAIHELWAMPPTDRQALREGAFEQARTLSWSNQIQRFYADLETRLKLRTR